MVRYIHVLEYTLLFGTRPYYSNKWLILIHILIIGVKTVETNVDEKSVIVSAEGVTADEMVEKLSKWSQASGKYVKIA